MVISEIIQSSYVVLLNSVYNRFIKKIPTQRRTLLLYFTFAVFSAYFILLRSSAFYETLLGEQNICQFIGGALLLLVALLSMNSEVKTVQWRKSMTIPLVLLGLGLVGIGLMHPIGEGFGFFGIMLIFVYPCLYIVWSNREDYEKLFDTIAFAFISTGMIYFILYAYLDYMNIESESGGRHTGGLYNANFLSFVGITVSCAALYYFYRCLENRDTTSVVAKGLSILSIAMGIILIIMGKSRSTVIIFFACILVIVFVLVKNKLIIDKGWGKRQIIILLSGLFVTMLISLLLLGKYTSALSRFSFSNVTVDQFSSGRLSIWSNYIHNINLLGHDMTNVDWESLTAGIPTMHAHNTFLEFSYRCGIVVGIAVIAFQAVAGILTLACMFNKRKIKGYEVFTLLFTIHYLVLSLIDIATIPMTNYAAFFFYICVSPLFIANNDRKTDAFIGETKNAN